MDELVIPEDGLLAGILEVEEDIKPAILVPIAISEMDDEDLDEDKELEIDPEEPDQIEEGQIIEDITKIVLGPDVEIAQIAAV